MWPWTLRPYWRRSAKGGSFQRKSRTSSNCQLGQRDFKTPREPLCNEVAAMLEAAGITQLYTHQAQALDAAREGRDWVVVTGTASGKTLCFHLPVLEACRRDPETRALFLYPTKALAQDQQKGLARLLDCPAGAGLQAGVYDGDTPPARRRRIRGEANLVLSNPDMLHASILPYHPKWSRFFENLRYVVLDEIHTFRGILGSHVACVLRRLQRVCRHYGSDPTFLAASATIANPQELTSRLIGRPVEQIDEDGSPRGRKFFVLWNPAARPAGIPRRTAADDAVWWMIEAMEQGGQALAFTRTRQAAELVQRYARQQLRDANSPLADRVRAYRGGYLPNERREIERELFAGRLSGVAATNALELGVDIGSLDVALLVQYPGTFASVWQQAGRSGRRHSRKSGRSPGGQRPYRPYLLRHPEYFFAQSPEHAVVDPENPYVLARHLQAAACELPLEDAELPRFGNQASAISETLREAGHLTRVADVDYYAGADHPAHRISLRHMSDNTFSIVLQRGTPPEREPMEGELSRSIRGDRSAIPVPPAKQQHEVIANVDAISAPELVYPEAVYLHHGQSYFVRELDLNGKVAYVERREMDYYTQAVLDSRVRITEAVQERDEPYGQVGLATVDVTWKTVGFKKIKFSTRENIGFGPVDIPGQNLPTTAMWLLPGPAIRQTLRREGWKTSEAVCGLRNLAVEALPMISMCDARDISGVVDSQNLDGPAMILYDRYPGGLGYCEQAFLQPQRLLEICLEMAAQCPCDDGCPSCVGLPNLRPAIHSDPDLSRGYPIPDKQAALRLLDLLTNSNSRLGAPHAAAP